MLRKSLLAVFTLVVCVGMTLSEEIRAVITKVEGNKVTFAPLEGKGKDAKKGEPAEPIEGGLKALKINPEKGLRANITTDADNKKITAITVFGGKKKSQ